MMGSWHSCAAAGLQSRGDYTTTPNAQVVALLVEAAEGMDDADLLARLRKIQAMQGGGA